MCYRSIRKAVIYFNMTHFTPSVGFGDTAGLVADVCYALYTSDVVCFLFCFHGSFKKSCPLSAVICRGYTSHQWSINSFR